MERPVSKFANDPDEDLLAYIALDPSAVSAREAGGELYDRHRKPLFGLLKRTWGRFIEPERLADLVHDTFLAAFKSAASFSGTGRGACLNWLTGIAKNLLKQELQRGVSVRADLALADEQDPAWELSIPENVPESAAVAMTEHALATLTEREQEVVRVTLEFHRPGDKHQRLPNSVAAGLAKQWSTTTTNIRMIRKRAMDKLKAYLETNLKKRGQK